MHQGRRTLFTFLLLFLLLPPAVLAQQAGRQAIGIGDSTLADPPDKAGITGSVADASGEPIQGVSILIAELQKGTTTDSAGRYAITLPPSTYTLKFSFIGYETVTRRVRLYSGGSLNVTMREVPIDMNEIIIRGKQYDDNITGIVTGIENISISEMQEIPVLLGEADVVNTLKLLPGVSSVGEGASGFNVRGGRTDQNLVLMEGAPLFNSSHVLGLFSTFNPDITESFTLFKGHIPARFGGKLSSVLNVKMRDGSYDAFKLKGGVGLAAGRLSIEGPLGDNTSYLVGGRATYSDWLLRIPKEPDISNSSASFYDTNIRLTHRFPNDHNLALSFYQSSDDFRFSDRFGYAWGSRLGSLNWTALAGDRLVSEFSAAYGSYESSYNDPSGVDAFVLRNGITYLNIKENIFYSWSDTHSLNAGAEWNYYDGHPETLGPFDAQSGVLPQRIPKEQGREMALYVSDDLSLGKVEVSLGLRYSYYQNLGPDRVYRYKEGSPRTVQTIRDTLDYESGEVIASYGGLEPRLSARISLGEHSSTKLSYNLTRQYNHTVSNSTSPTPADIRQVSNTHIPAQVAHSFTAGYFQNFRDDVWETSMQLYYKRISDLVEYRNFAELFLNDHLETELLTGRGKSYGLELNIEKAEGKWTGWLAYTYARTFVRIPAGHLRETVNDGEWFPSNYDQPHSVVLVAKRRLGKKSSFGLNFTYKSGRPITAIVSSYTSGSTSIPVFSDRNSYRIPDYIRLDVSFTVAENIWKNRTVDPDRRYQDSMTIAFYNVLSRDNAFSIFYQRPEGAASTIPQPFKLSVLGAVIPSVTYNFSF